MKYFTEKELEIINLVLQGFTNKEIAGKLFLSVHTVKSYLENIYQKANVCSRVALVVFVIKNKIFNFE